MSIELSSWLRNALHQLSQNLKDPMKSNSLRLAKDDAQRSASAKPNCGAEGMSTSSDYWTEEQVSVDRLLTHFRNSSIPVESWPDETLRIAYESGAPFRIHVDFEHKRIYMFCAYRLREDAHRLDKLEFVNRLNDATRYLRWSLNDDSRLWVDYTASFRGGALPYQIVALTREFNALVTDSLQKMDMDSNLVE